MKNFSNGTTVMRAAVKYLVYFLVLFLPSFYALSFHNSKDVIERERELTAVVESPSDSGILQPRNYLLEGSNDRKDVFSSYSEEPGELKNQKYVDLGFTRLTYGDVLAIVTFLQRPRRIVEFGILHGFALDIWIKRSPEDCKVEAYDLFENNKDGHLVSRQDEVKERFKGYSKLVVKHADFYAEAEQILSDGDDVDILHIDVNNSGDTVDFTVNKLLKNVRVGGVIIFEGGSKPRDSLAPKERAMHDALSTIATRSDVEVIIVEAFPSMSILRKLD